MKLFVFVLSVVLLGYSCKKDVVIEPDPGPDYSTPWDTQYIHYDHVYGCNNSPRSHGPRLYYKDSIMIGYCGNAGSFQGSFSDPLIVNNSVYHVFLSGYVWSTSNGGLDWKRYNVYDRIFHSYHVVTPELTYCIGGNGNNFNRSYRVSGIGKSSLDAYEIFAPTTTQYITDSTASMPGIDSVFIPVNDSVDFVILLN